MQRVANMRMQQMGQMFQPGGAGGYFVPTLPTPQRFYGPAQMTQMRPQPRWPNQPTIRPNAQTPGTGNSLIKTIKNRFNVLDSSTTPKLDNLYIHKLSS